MMNPPETQEQTNIKKLMTAYNFMTTVLQNISGLYGECPICLDPIDNPVVSNCGHMICQTCFINGRDTLRACPICRNRDWQPNPNHTLVKKIVDHIQLPCPNHFDFHKKISVTMSMKPKTKLSKPTKMRM